MPYTAKAFGVIKVTRRTYGQLTNGQHKVDRITLSRVVQGRPAVTSDEVVVEIELNFPDDFFDQNTPKAQVTFPTLPPMTVQASGKVTKGLAPSAAASVVQHP